MIKHQGDLRPARSTEGPYRACTDDARRAGDKHMLPFPVREWAHLRLEKLVCHDDDAPVVLRGLGCEGKVMTEGGRGKT